jgi:uncharacterized protein
VSGPLAWREVKQGLELALRVTPNAGANRIEGVDVRDDGTAVLRVRVTAVPDKGKANKAVIALLSKTLHMPKSAIVLTAGETARLKTVLIAGDAKEIAAVLAGL